MSEQPQRPTTDDRDAWRAYWTAVGMPWRTEPEIAEERQHYLAERRAITPDIEQGIYPFKDIKLIRADVEWLLATHEGGRGPVDWSDEKQRTRGGVDVRGADVRGQDLRDLPLAHLRGGLLPWTGSKDEWLRASPEQREMASTLFENAYLRYAHFW